MFEQLTVSINSRSKSEKSNIKPKSCADDLNEIIPVLEYNFTLLEKNIDSFHDKIKTKSTDTNTVIYKVDEFQRESLLQQGVDLAN